MANKPNCIWRTALASLAVGAVAVLGAFAQRSVPTSGEFKNLGGPADEIVSMRLTDPASLGTRSRAAMIPIDASAATQEFSIPVDTPSDFRLVLLSPDASEMTILAASAGESWFDLRTPGAAARWITRAESTYGIDGNAFPAEVFSFGSLKVGTLRVRIEKPSSFASPTGRAGWLVASSGSNYRLYSYIDTARTTVGSEIGVVASLFDANTDPGDGVPAPIAPAYAVTRAEITAPDGSRFTIPMTDVATGSVRGGFRPATAGRYTAQVVTSGRTFDGTEILRTAELAFEVAPSRLSINGAVRATPVDDLRLDLSVPVRGATPGRTYLVHAEIWTKGEAGDPLAWAGGMTRAAATGGKGRASALSVMLDTRWLVSAKEGSAFELRNVRVQDPETNVVLAEADSMALPASVAPTSQARSFYGADDDAEMRMGRRPARLAATNAVGGKLMLVHGYCSGDAWGPAAAAGQFSNYVKFLDLNKNRSHDQFARLIRDFGATLPSFGVVAHSQGGAAALHLYTYYWSGLDAATGTRLIQSVGTPYRGTALAGNLALLGQLFGAGCGSNTDLSYSGAASWLAGIPTWARAKVYYHTSSFTDVWYRYDYCNIATDPFLSDPDDGVVEQAYAQLSGGNNLGHKTGWCHTSGMRDPAQTSDASRNSVMNANAAR